jgi:glycine cleavage system H protein
MNIPDNCRYTKDHEWIRLEGNIAYIGITDFAQGELGELVYIEVDTVGETVNEGDVFGTVEAVKTTSDLYMPLTGKVIEFNPALDDSKSGDPALINSDPYGGGWIIKAELEDVSKVADLLDAAAYQKHIA